MSGLFGTFGIAKRGMFAQQNSLNITSHNIANAKTEGYSRQRAELQTTNPYCKPSLFSASGPGQVGTGVEVVAINRVRDNFLDYHTRVELGVQGWYSGRDKFLSQVENVLNEPTETGISTLIGKFFDGWHQLSKQGETSSAKKVVAEQALALTNEFNHTFNELQKLKENTQMMIKDTVFDVNNILHQINQLNQEIVQVSVTGQMPNDLMDRRDLLIDKLSQKFGVKIDKKDYEGIDLTIESSLYGKDGGNSAKPPISLKDKTINLVQNINPDEAATFSYVSAIEKTATDGEYKVTYYKKGDLTSEANKVTATVKMTADEAKTLDECRVIWSDRNGDAFKVDANGKVKGSIGKNDSINFADMKLFKPLSGEFKGYMSVQEDIDVNIEQVNKLAKAFALSINAVYSQSSTFTKDDLVTDPKTINNFFVKTNGSNTEADEIDINAGNITVNTEIVKNNMLIKAGKENKPGESDGKRALAIAMLRDRLMSVQNVNATSKRGDLATLELDTSVEMNTIKSNLDGMTLDNYFKDTVDRLGIQEQEAKRMVKNQSTLLKGFKQSREAVSGVSLDEEMANLIQYNHCYAANAKVIATVDQLLEVVVNGLKR